MSEEALEEELDTSEPEAEQDKEADEDVVSFSDSAGSLANKDEERRRIQSEIEAFLAGGGKINSVPNNVVADPPKKPESKYGSQPI
jgi:hypothetical protein